MAPIEKARSASIPLSTIREAGQKKLAEDADKLGNRDGRVSLHEVDAFALQQVSSVPNIVGAIAAPFNAFGQFRDALGLVETIESAQELDVSSIKDETQKKGAQAADQAGNKDGKVTLAELKDYVLPNLAGTGPGSIARLKEIGPLLEDLQDGKGAPEKA